MQPLRSQKGQTRAHFPDNLICQKVRGQRLSPRYSKVVAPVFEASVHTAGERNEQRQAEKNRPFKPAARC